MSKTHVEVIVLYGIEKAAQFLIGAFYKIEEFKYFESDDKASNNGGHIFLIEEDEINESGYG